MQFYEFLLVLATAIQEEDVGKLVYHLRPYGPNVNELLNGLHDSRRQALSRFSNSIVEPWGDIAITHVQVVINLVDGSHVEAYKEHAALVQAFLKFFTANTGWTLPLVYSLLRDLRALGEKADVAEYYISGQRTKWLEDVARICNKAFSSCVIDRTSPKGSSRKWGTYYTVGLVLKCYFKIDNTSLARNVLRALKANPDVPSLSDFPRAHQVTYRYYIGMLSFLNEEYANVKAEQEFTFAFYNCHRESQKNLSQVLMYLVPLRLLRGHLPSNRMLDRFPDLRRLYTPFIQAIQQGDLKSYDAALVAQKRLLDLGLHLVLEKAREICMRCLFRKVWLALEKPTRIPIRMFHAGLRSAGQDIPVEEAECLTAIMIYRGYMRGYISHEKQTVVLAASGAFPDLHLRPNAFA